MITDFEEFVQGLGVDTKSAGKDVGYNDFNVDCPYCGYDKHLGIHRQSGYINCWVCQFDGIVPRPRIADLVALWAGVPLPVARDMLRRAKGYGVPKPQMPHASQVVWPSGCSSFSQPANRHDRDLAYTYLKRRGVTTDDIDEHRLMFTPRVVSRREDEPSYAGRIIMPVTLGGEAVNWVGRDYTGTQKLKYKNAITTMAVVPMSALLWGLDKFIASGERWLRLCEGIFDAMTLGVVGASVQKSTLSVDQLALIGRAKPEVVSVIFDPATGVDRHVKARALAALYDISAFVNRVKLVELTGGDVAELGADKVLRAEREAKFWAI